MVVPVPTIGNIPLNCSTSNWQAKDKFLEWKGFRSEVKNVFTRPCAAMEGIQKAAFTINWMFHDGSKLVNSGDIDTCNTA